nr:exosome complex component RRP46 [Oncorhynchus nerka]
MDVCASSSPTLREFGCEQNLLSRPDGSSSFVQGDTSVLAGVYGPAEVKVSKEIYDRATLEVVMQPKVGLPAFLFILFYVSLTRNCSTLGKSYFLIEPGPTGLCFLSQESRALMTFAIDSTERRVMMSSTRGSFTVHELQQCIAVSQKASDKIFQFYRDSVRRRYSKTL